jgi:hypothetical protein
MREAGWFHTTREKLKLGFKASLRLPNGRLTPTGRGLERGQNLWLCMRNQDLCIFLFSYETTLPLPMREGEKFKVSLLLGERGFPDPVKS